jgi:hypothetical protein
MPEEDEPARSAKRARRSQRGRPVDPVEHCVGAAAGM